MLAMCVLFACSVNSVYWMYRMRTTNAMPELSTDAVRTELESLPVGNTSNGEQIFASTGGCHACHSLETDVKTVGPSLFGIASRAAIFKSDYSAELYIYESIVYPNAHVVESFQSGIMPLTFKQQLGEQQIADLLAFLMTQ